jgi:hypothetical protein
MKPNLPPLVEIDHSKFDPIRFQIVDAIEKYVDGDGRPMSDNTKREVVGAYLSGMLMACHWTTLRSGEPTLMPALLHAKCVEVAKIFGMDVS